MEMLVFLYFKLFSINSIKNTDNYEATIKFYLGVIFFLLWLVV